MSVIGFSLGMGVMLARFQAEGNFFSQYETFNNTEMVGAKMSAYSFNTQFAIP